MNHLRSKSLQYIANTTFRRRICSPPWRKYTYSTATQEIKEVEIDQRNLPTDFDPATFDPTQHRSPPTERVFRLVDELSSLTLLEISELSDILMKRLGVTELPAMGVMQPGTAMAAAAMAGGAAKPAEEVMAKAAKTAFDLRLEGFEAASKIKVIKEVRAITDLGLKEAKELVEKSPAVLKKGVTKEEGEQMMEKLKAAGAKVALE